jgi:uncharacterized membrane protein (UPF0127 family)
MDPKRPVKQLSDLSQYSPFDPILNFYRRQGVESTKPMQYALEMNKGWFKANKIKAGDIAIWNSSEENGEIIHSVPIKKRKRIQWIHFPTMRRYALKSKAPMELLFLNRKNRILHIQATQCGTVFPPFPFASVLAAPTGWSKQNGYQAGELLRK